MVKAQLWKTSNSLRELTGHQWKAQVSSSATFDQQAQLLTFLAQIQLGEMFLSHVLVQVVLGEVKRNI